MQSATVKHLAAELSPRPACVLRVGPVIILLATIIGWPAGVLAVTAIAPASEPLPAAVGSPVHQVLPVPAGSGWLTLSPSQQPQYLELPAQVEAVSQSTVSAQTSGRIVELPFDVNDLVPQGAVVVRFTDTEQQARLQQAQAAQNEAQVRQNELAKELTRVQGIYAKQLVAKAALDVAQANFNAATARKAQADAAVKAAAEQLEQTVVRAPYSGILQQRLVELGELATPGKPLLVGLSLEHLRLSSQLGQQQLSVVRHSEQARILLPDDTSIELGKPAITIAPQANSASHSFLLRLQLPRADYAAYNLYPGSWARLQLQTGWRTVLQIPAAAVIWRGEVAMVWRKTAQVDTPQLQPVRLRQQGSGYELISGLAAGDVIAADALTQLQQQGAVTAQERR